MMYVCTVCNVETERAAEVRMTSYRKPATGSGVLQPSHCPQAARHSYSDTLTKTTK